ncbi:MAG: polyketide cyclase [Chloroflexi bacterium]|nr:MAG: polyketide cyclase [Chloroflexota bacterium]
MVVDELDRAEHEGGALRIVTGQPLPDPVAEIRPHGGDGEEDVQELEQVVEHAHKILDVPVTYHFRTEWRFVAPVDRTWSVVLDIERYPGWWKNFRRVTVIRGDGKSIGSVVECEVRGSLPYSLTYSIEILEAQRPRHLLVRSSGELVGTGRWEFSEPVPGESLAVYYWDVATTNPILNLIAPLARNALASNHTRVMANGYAALKPQVEAVPR